jgi:uncharacterized membrane protein
MPFFQPFRAAERQRLLAAIRAAELTTSGEIRVHVQRHCSQDPCRDAAQRFERLGMTRTAARNGGLIFVAWRAHRFAIIGDSGIHEKVGEAFWRATAAAMTPHFVAGDLVAGIEAGVLAAGEALRQNFPRQPDDRNELPDEISHG